MKLTKLLYPFLLVLLSCQSYSSQKLTHKDSLRIKSLGLLDNDEKILMYTANYKKEVAGSFFTDKRIARYWIDEHNSIENAINSAYFEEIISIHPIYNTTSFIDASYLIVTKRDSTRFNVYVSGSRKEVDRFFLPAIEKWKKVKASQK